MSPPDGQCLCGPANTKEKLKIKRYQCEARNKFTAYWCYISIALRALQSPKRHAAPDRTRHGFDRLVLSEPTVAPELRLDRNGQGFGHRHGLTVNPAHRHGIGGPTFATKIDATIPMQHI